MGKARTRRRRRIGALAVIAIMLCVLLGLTVLGRRPPSPDVQGLTAQQALDRSTAPTERTFLELLRVSRQR